MMKNMKEETIDCPVSEVATTEPPVPISGFRPLILHPRIDFMLLAVDQIVTQALNGGICLVVTHLLL